MYDTAFSERVTFKMLLGLSQMWRKRQCGGATTKMSAYQWWKTSLQSLSYADCTPSETSCLHLAPMSFLLLRSQFFFPSYTYPVKASSSYSCSNRRSPVWFAVLLQYSRSETGRCSSIIRRRSRGKWTSNGIFHSSIYFQIFMYQQAGGDINFQYGVVFLNGLSLTVTLWLLHPVTAALLTLSRGIQGAARSSARGRDLYS